MCPSFCDYRSSKIYFIRLSTVYRYIFAILSLRTSGLLGRGDSVGRSDRRPREQVPAEPGQISEVTELSTRRSCRRTSTNRAVAGQRGRTPPLCGFLRAGAATPLARANCSRQRRPSKNSYRTTRRLRAAVEIVIHRLQDLIHRDLTVVIDIAKRAGARRQGLQGYVYQDNDFVDCDLTVPVAVANAHWGRRRTGRRRRRERCARCRGHR